MTLYTFLLVLIALATTAAMELFAWWAHKYVMHGWGWDWHQSHHEEREGMFEKNDLYAVVFAGFAITLFVIGGWFWLPVVMAFAAGITGYGFLYFVCHDGLVHQRWPFNYVPHRGYAKRLVQAHRLHHAVEGKDHGVSFGFLYSPPIDRIRAELRASGVLEAERRQAQDKATDGFRADAPLA